MNQIGSQIEDNVPVEPGALVEQSPHSLFKTLSDPTRLQTLLLIQEESELCVCELTEALNLSQPKVSRHLAQLRNTGLLSDRRQGQWVFYRFAETMPGWVVDVLQVTAHHNAAFMETARYRLAVMKDRPDRCC